MARFDHLLRRRVLVVGFVSIKGPDGSLGNGGRRMQEYALECGHPAPPFWLPKGDGFVKCGECAKVPHPRTNPEKWRFA